MTSVFVDPAAIHDRFAHPFCLPQTRLLRNTEVVVGTMRLAVGWRAELALLAMHFIGVETADLPAKISGNLHMVFVGLYQGVESINSHTGRPLVYVGADVAGYVDSNPFGLHPLAEPGHYTVLLVNNTQNVDFQVAVSGVFRIART